MEEEQDIEEDCGHYVRFRTLIFHGLFKTSFRGVDRHLGTEVSWNRIDLLSGLVNEDKMLTEVKVLQTSRHPNMVEFYDSWHTDTNGVGSLVYISEIFQTGSLKQFLKKARKIKTKVVQTWCKQLLEALNHLHSLNPPVIHRDVKCDNVFITPSGELKLGDLGLVTKNHDNYFSLFGTLEFLAPECLVQEPATEKIDIWSFGMAVIEMITGEYPYGEFSSGEALKAIFGGTKPAILEKMATKSPFLSLINKCLVQVEDRPSAKHLLQYLTTLQEDESAVIELPSQQERVTGTTSRNPHLVFISKIDGEFRLVDASSEKKKQDAMKIESEISQKVAPLPGHGSSQILNGSVFGSQQTTEPLHNSSSSKPKETGSLPRTNSFDRTESAFRVSVGLLDEKPSGSTIRLKVILSSADALHEFEVLFDASKDPSDLYEEIRTHVLALDLKKSAQYIHDLKKIIMSHIYHCIVKIFPEYKNHYRSREHHKERDHHHKERDHHHKERDHHHSHYHGHHSSHSSHSKEPSSHSSRSKTKINGNSSLPQKSLQRKLSNVGSSPNLVAPKSPPLSPRSKKPARSPTNSRPTSPPSDRITPKRESNKKSSSRKKMRAENPKLSQAKKLQALEQQLFDEALHVEALLYANTFMTVPHDLTTANMSDLNISNTSTAPQSVETREFLQFVLKQLFPPSTSISNSSSQLTTPSASTMVTPIGSRSSSPARGHASIANSANTEPLEDLLSQVHLNQSGYPLTDSSQFSPDSSSPNINCSGELDMIQQKNDSPSRSPVFDEQKIQQLNGLHHSVNDEVNDEHQNQLRQVPPYPSMSSDELIGSSIPVSFNPSSIARPVSPVPTGSFITHLPSSVFSPPTHIPAAKPAINNQQPLSKRASNEFASNNAERTPPQVPKQSLNSVDYGRNGTTNGVLSARSPLLSELKKANEMMTNNDLSISQTGTVPGSADHTKSQDVNHQYDLDNKLAQATDITKSVTGAEWS